MHEASVAPRNELPIPPPSGRERSLDLLRGWVMLLMALDHVRDFVHRGAMTGLPTDLDTTTPAIFATRWITHICAPAFALTAGMGAWFHWQRGGSKVQTSKFLLTRGLWLILLELLVMRFAYYFSFSLEYTTPLLVLWSLGLSMILLAALIWLPQRLVLIGAVAIILLHPLLAVVSAGSAVMAATFWDILHGVAIFNLANMTFVAPYSLLPWAAVMALGFAIAPVVRREPAARRRQLIKMGIGSLLLFAALRAINQYGDPSRWQVFDSATFTVMSFLNVSKYPASPAFLLMTLGTVLLLLAWCDQVARSHSRVTDRVAMFGRVPLFYYILHFYVAHLAASVIALTRYGHEATHFLFKPYPSFGGPANSFPADFGVGLATTYGVWLVVVATCYPLCQRFARAKQRGTSSWMRYF